MDTRSAILQQNFAAIHKSGFQAVRTDKVIAELGITKGAFYHYFPDKFAMGYAIVEEIIAPMYLHVWETVAQQPVHALDALSHGIRHVMGSATAETIHLGCPLNNLIQEMSAQDGGFQQRLARIVELQTALISKIIERGIAAGEIRPVVQPEPLATFLLSSLEGSFSIAKSRQSYPAFTDSIHTLLTFLQTLRA